MSGTQGNQARVMVTVAVPPAEAFRIFTEEIDRWWRRGPRFRNAPGVAAGSGLIAVEPHAGGRVFESYDAEGGPRVIEIGSVLVWEPPFRLVFTWRGSNFAAGESTEVEVGFAPSGKNTQVTVVHRGWRDLRADHPVRHGLTDAEFVRMIGMWWGELMTSMRVFAKH